MFGGHPHLTSLCGWQAVVPRLNKISDVTYRQRFVVSCSPQSRHSSQL